MATIKAKFEKEKIKVGLSSVDPIGYVGAEEKYIAADFLSESKFVFEKERESWEVIIVTDDLVRTPERDRCYRIISAMPREALCEVEEDLVETYSHYLSLSFSEPKGYIESPKLIKPKVMA